MERAKRRERIKRNVLTCLRLGICISWQMVRRCSGYTPWRLQRACAQVARTPFSTSLFSPPAPGPSLFLRPTTGFFLHLGSARQSVPGVCTHSAQRPPLGAPTLSHPAVRGQPTSWEQLRRIVLPRSIATVEDLCGRSTILEVILRRWHGSSARAENAKEKKTASWCIRSNVT